ncbi:MAG TPA: hypothetical protein VFX16_30450 [Pseudonocardiaceae bacterium]|nr:hypothetical protein [Pseudonocardiaceae bacterium]
MVLVAGYTKSKPYRSLVALADFRNNRTKVEPNLDIVCTAERDGLQEITPHMNQTDLSTWRDRLARRIKKG